MNKTLSMFLFVIILGALTSGLLLGMDLLTRERIDINKEYVWRTTILEHNDISYTTVNFIDFFKGEDPVIRTETKEDPITGEVLTIYVNDETGYISLYFKGTGLWGPMEGILTMESDFMTIVDVSVLVQAETPGLGGVVSERKHLDQYAGKRFDSFTGLSGIRNEAFSESEIVIVSGASGTSNAFLLSLNQNHAKYARVFEKGEVSTDFAWKSAILDHNNVVYNTDNYSTKFDDEFNVLTADNAGETVTVYQHKVNKNISYLFEADGFIGPIEGVVTLNEDFKTIVNITITLETENRGGDVDERYFLDQFIGKVFDIDDGLVYVETSSAENEVDILAGATTTTNALVTALNTTRNLYAELFGIGEVSVKKYAWYKAMLMHNNVAYTEENFIDKFEENFITSTKYDNGKEYIIYEHKTNKNISFFFVGDGFIGPIEGIATLNEDFKTIVNISITSQTENRGNDVDKRSYLDQFIGKIFDIDDGLVYVETSNEDNEVDILAGATNTTKGLIEALNETRVLLGNLFDLGEVSVKKYDWYKAMLMHNNIIYTEENFLDKFEENFTTSTKDDNGKEYTIYQHKTNKNISFFFVGDGFIGPIEGIITLNEDFKTIVNISITFETENRGSDVDERSFLDQFIGKIFDKDNGLIYVEISDAENEVDILAGATNTTKGLVESLNETRDLLAIIFELGGE